MGQGGTEIVSAAPTPIDKRLILSIVYPCLKDSRTDFDVSLGWEPDKIDESNFVGHGDPCPLSLLGTKPQGP